MASLSGPHGYAQARMEANNSNSNDSDNNSSTSFVRTIENRPYFPLLKVDLSNEATIIEVAQVIVSCGNNSSASDEQCTDNNITNIDATSAKVTVITGGLTNALFKVDLPNTSTNNSTNNNTNSSSVLVRIFGAEGMINRDEETTNFARLCQNHTISESTTSANTPVVHDQLDLLGRFANGRVETWIPNMRQAHHVEDFEKVGLSLEVARQLARLHYGFRLDAVASTTSTISDNDVSPEPTLWKVMESWIDELSQITSRDVFEDAPLMELFSRATSTPESTCMKSFLSSELAWLKARVETQFPRAPIVFCHNDVNAANVLLDASIDEQEESSYDRRNVCIIDYEYGSINYAMYDVANFACEHCGGNDYGIPNYGLLPGSERMVEFLKEYGRERDATLKEGGADAAGVAHESEEEKVSDLHSQVELFQMASNLYWGIWGVLQAAGEVNDGTFVMENAGSRLEGDSDLEVWDNLRYGKNRLERFHVCKEGLLRND